MAKILKLNSFSDPRGKLTVIEKELPYPIQRAYFIYDVPTDTERGGHSHKVTTQVLICTVGSCIVECSYLNREKEIYHLDTPDKALILDPEDYHIMKDFQKGTVLLVLSSHKYDANDYINERR